MSSEPFECPLAQIKIISCPVKTCAYHTIHETGNCLMQRGLTEDVEFNADEIAKARGINPLEFRNLAQKGQRAIQRVLVLHDFLTWLDKKPWHTYPKVEGYRDSQLIEWVEHHLLKHPPYSLPQLAWNMGKIAASLTDKIWKEYCKHKEIEFQSTSIALGLPRRKIEEALEAFKLAHKRSIIKPKVTS